MPDFCAVSHARLEPLRLVTRRLLHVNADLDVRHIDVRVEEGTVYLTGRVATSMLRDKAIAIARGTANVQAVVDSGLVVN